MGGRLSWWRAAVLALVLGVVSASSAPAAGAAPRAAVTRSASAGWQLADPFAGSLSLSVNELAQPGGGHASAFAFATQERHCDEATDEWVFRSFRYAGPIDARSVHINPTLQAAGVAAVLPVAVSEQRFPDCDVEPTGIGGRLVDRGTVDVRVQASWRATGPASPTGPDVVTRPAAVHGRLHVAGLGTLRLPASAGSISAAAG
jgi:hypothetical protein